MSYFKNTRSDNSTFVCDDCGDELPCAGTDFYPALEEAKDNGWRARREGGDWLHLCPDCTDGR